MTQLQPPFTDPTWQAIARETDLAMQLLCLGANEISRADFTHQGKYTSAQFGLANGLERLGKLILTVNNLLLNGAPLTDKQLRSRGHTLPALLDDVERIETSLSLRPTFKRPNNPITDRALLRLDSFAAASRGRYANHASLNGNLSPHDPIITWWQDVCEPILERHFRGTDLERRASDESRQVGVRLADSTTVLHFHEDSSVVTRASQVCFMAHERRVTQRWGRYYTLCIARWMSDVFTEMSRDPGYREGTEYLLGHYEQLATFRVPDEFLRKRRVWPLV